MEREQRVNTDSVITNSRHNDLRTGRWDTHIATSTKRAPGVPSSYWIAGKLDRAGIILNHTTAKTSIHLLVFCRYIPGDVVWRQYQNVSDICICNAQNSVYLHTRPAQPEPTKDVFAASDRCECAGTCIRDRICTSSRGAPMEH